MTVLLALIALAALLFCAALAVVVGRCFLVTLYARWHIWTWPKRLGFIAAGIALLASPYLAIKGVEYGYAIRRVPEPLDVSGIEYRVEDAWGFGLPSGKETGFIVYRLTDGSTNWVRSKGEDLSRFLPGGPKRWRRTPVLDNEDGGRRWHPYDDEFAQPKARHGPDVDEYLDKYGFGIAVDHNRTIEFNQAVRSAGSFYAYERGGGVMVIDPKRGKVYLAYAG